MPSSWQAKKVAVTTVSQLLDASEDVFQRAATAADSNFSIKELIHINRIQLRSTGDIQHGMT